MLASVAAEAARRFGDRTAFVSPSGWSLSYGELDEASDEVAAGLLRRGLGEGGVVALMLHPSPEYAVAYLAAAKIGAIAAGVNHRLSGSERVAVLGVAVPRLVLASAGDVALPASTDLGGADVVEVEPASGPNDLLAALRVRGEAPPPLAEDPERAVAIVFTSGTTGTPRGAVFGGRQLEAITGIDTRGRWEGGGVTYQGTSMAHLAFMTKFPGRLMSGAPTYIMERWRASDALRMVVEHRMTRLGGIPTQVALMMRDPDFDHYDLSCVQLIVIGGGPATPSLVREARERFHAPVMVRYSCTEAGIGTGTAIDDPPEDAEISVGRPQPGVTLTVTDDRGRALPQGEIGEICLRSAAVMSRYHRDPEATAEAFTADGSVRTGDLGWIDDAGRLRLVGRSKEMYVRGGYNVYPAEVENVLAEFPGVADVAVHPRPDDVMGEIGVAVVVPTDAQAPPSLDDLRAFGTDRLARYKLPEALVVVDALPLTAMDKVDRSALGALVQTDDLEHRS